MIGAPGARCRRNDWTLAAAAADMLRGLARQNLVESRTRERGACSRSGSRGRPSTDRCSCGRGASCFGSGSRLALFLTLLLLRLAVRCHRRRHAQHVLLLGAGSLAARPRTRGRLTSYRRKDRTDRCSCQPIERHGARQAAHGGARVRWSAAGTADRYTAVLMRQTAAAATGGTRGTSSSSCAAFGLRGRMHVSTEADVTLFRGHRRGRCTCRSRIRTVRVVVRAAAAVVEQSSIVEVHNKLRGARRGASTGRMRTAQSGRA